MSSKQSLIVTYNDGSNPFLVLAVEKSVVQEHIDWQRKHNPDVISNIYVTDWKGDTEEVDKCPLCYGGNRPTYNDPNPNISGVVSLQRLCDFCPKCGRAFYKKPDKIKEKVL